jgi:hypothetical protein
VSISIAFLYAEFQLLVPAWDGPKVRKDNKGFIVRPGGSDCPQTANRVRYRTAEHRLVNPKFVTGCQALFPQAQDEKLFVKINSIDERRLTVDSIQAEAG